MTPSSELSCKTSALLIVTAAVAAAPSLGMTTCTSTTMLPEVIVRETSDTEEALTQMAMRRRNSPCAVVSKDATVPAIVREKVTMDLS